MICTLDASCRRWCGGNYEATKCQRESRALLILLVIAEAEQKIVFLMPVNAPMVASREKVDILLEIKIEREID